MPLVTPPRFWRGSLEDRLFTGPLCLAIRRRWGIKMDDIATRAKVPRRMANSWERLRIDNPRHPFPFADRLSDALAWLIADQAIATLENFLPRSTALRDRLRALVVRINEEDAKP